MLSLLNMGENNKTLKTSGNEKGGDGRHRFVQTRLNASDHLSLSVIALERDITLTDLLKEIIKDFLTKTKEKY